MVVTKMSESGQPPSPAAGLYRGPRIALIEQSGSIWAY